MPSFCRYFGGLYLGDTELQVRVVAAMSSGEGAEETTKDASDIEAFFKTGKPRKRVGEVGLSSAESSPLVQLWGDIFSCPCCGFGARTVNNMGGFSH